MTKQLINPVGQWWVGLIKYSQSGCCDAKARDKNEMFSFLVLSEVEEIRRKNFSTLAHVCGRLDYCLKLSTFLSLPLWKIIFFLSHSIFQGEHLVLCRCLSALGSVMQLSLEQQQSRCKHWNVLVELGSLLYLCHCHNKSILPGRCFLFILNKHTRNGPEHNLVARNQFYPNPPPKAELLSPAQPSLIQTTLADLQIDK